MGEADQKTDIQPCPAVKIAEFLATGHEIRYGGEVLTDYGGKYLKIRKAIHEAGFDEFYQAGNVNHFSKMNIVAESAVLNIRFWICIDGGYGVKDKFYIARRNLSADDPAERTYYNNQEELAAALSEIGDEIRQKKAKDKSTRTTKPS